MTYARIPRWILNTARVAALAGYAAWLVWLDDADVAIGVSAVLLTLLSAIWVSHAARRIWS